MYIQELLNHYVKVQGQVISQVGLPCSVQYIGTLAYIYTMCLHCLQMIRKSVETRDWLHSMEPRSVRSVMKRVVEEITLLDKQVATLYEDGTKKEQGSGHGSLLFL